jgi:AraC-like DNA-binding protein
MLKFFSSLSRPTILFIAGVALFLCMCDIMLTVAGKTETIIDPQRVHAFSYDDRLEQTNRGNSEIISVYQDSISLRISYILKPGFSYPYAGIVLRLPDSSGPFFDCSRFNTLKIRIGSSQFSDCKIYLKIFDSKISKTDHPLSLRYLEKDLSLSSTAKTFSIPLNQFKTPDWWYQKNNITLKDAGPVDFSKVTTLQIESGPTAKTGITDTLNISGITFVKDARPHFILFAIFGVLIAVLAIINIKPRDPEKPIMITYDKKEIENYRDINAQRIAAYVAQHFSEPEISIITTGHSLGLSQKKVATTMKETFNLSFKQYLTSIRIHEAKRMLRETDRLVINIALEVGFNNVSHFNRVFKTSTSTNPVEFRNNPVLP